MSHAWALTVRSIVFPRADRQRTRLHKGICYRLMLGGLVHNGDVHRFHIHAIDQAWDKVPGTQRCECSREQLPDESVTLRRIVGAQVEKRRHAVER